MASFVTPAADVDLGELLGGAPIGVLIVDETTGGVLYHNQRAAEILEVEAMTEGRGLADAVAALRHAPVLAHGADMRDMMVEVRRPDGGGARTLQLSYGYIPHGMDEATIIWVYDVTEMQRARADAERAARHRSAFLATMSHEIRTPMNGVATLAQLLADQVPDGEPRDMVRTIRQSAVALLAILNDMLDFSKIEAGAMETEDRPYAPVAVLEGMAAILRPKAVEKGLALTLEVAPEVPAWVGGDGNRVRQILINLVGNAIKFTEHGGVAVRLAAPAPDRLRVEVEDSGIGLTGEQRMALFRPFVQADASVARRFGGSGLGLSICRGLVELMGGWIDVESTPGIGSLFFFEIDAPVGVAPVQGPDDESASSVPLHWTAPERAAAEAARAVVLCVEDNPTNRFVLQRVLGRLGIQHDMAVDGLEGLSALDRSRHGLVLTDLHMPVLDGYGLARAIRAREAAEGESAIPVLALSADAVRGTAEACGEAGMNGHLTKPIRIEALDAAIAEHLPAAHAMRRPAQTGVREPVEPAEPAALDLSLLTGLVGDDPAAIGMALDEFCGSAAGLVATIETHEDARERMMAAHSLKSASRCVGAADLAETAAALEDALREGRDDPAVGALAGAIRSRFDDALRRIRAYRAAGENRAR